MQWWVEGLGTKVKEEGKEEVEELWWYYQNQNVNVIIMS